MDENLFWWEILEAVKKQIHKNKENTSERELIRQMFSHACKYIFVSSSSSIPIYIYIDIYI